ncbi:MAG: glycosyltransferase [Clostridium cadaveris]|uniref:glycosyltransferase n=1 Tax=Clostridium cadaveris TaxID=1529 RepID=UPI002A8914B7|nr:glycosyltransferase [Clostridium cadaveris]
MEKYSVLMSLYIKEKPEYLEQSIDSMLNQTVKPDEIVIVEDGPLTDELLDVLKKYKNEHPRIFNIVKSKKNLGLGLALNLGLKNCKNELVARMDTDDISKPDRCEKQLQLFRNNSELVLVGSYIDEFYSDPSEIISTRRVPTEYKEIYEFAKRRSAFNHPTVMYKKSKIIAQGGYSNLRRNQDVDLFGRMLFTGYKAANINESLLLFRSNDDLSRRRKSWENTKSYISTIAKLRSIGYSTLNDYVIVTLGQILMFICPINVQNWLYRKFLRK